MIRSNMFVILSKGVKLETIRFVETGNKIKYDFCQSRNTTYSDIFGFGGELKQKK